MVKHKLKEKNGFQYKYEYFPEGDLSRPAGIIIVDTRAQTVFVETVAEDDFERHTTAKELNEMRRSINEMRIETGEPLLPEDEFPSAKDDSRWYYYADHAIDQLCDLFNSDQPPSRRHSGMVLNHSLIERADFR